MNKYSVEFERIGREHNVPATVFLAAGSDELAELILKYARPHLRSRDVEVCIDLEDGTGFIACGMHSGGNFTVAAL